MRTRAKRLLSLLTALVMILGMLPAVSAEERTYDGTEKLYVNLGAVDFWLNDNAVQKANFYGPSDNVWADLTLTDGTIYEVTVPAGTWTNVFLVRGDPNYTGDDFGSEASTGGFAWNRTAAIPLDAEKNYITTFFEDMPYAAWDTYVPSEDPTPVELPEIPLPNGDFELGDATNWILIGLPENPVRQNEWNEPNKTWTLNLWANDTEAVEIHATYPIKLTAGTYKFKFDISGEGKDSLLKWKVSAGDETLIEAANSVVTVDWNVWNTVETDTFTLDKDTEVVFDFGGTGPAGYWGDIDNLKLFGTGGIYVPMEEITLPNGDFELGDATNWLLIGLPENPVRQNEWNEPNKTWTLNLWANDTEAVEIHASYPVKLTAGTYKFKFDISGEGKDSLLKWKVSAGDETLIEAANSVVTVDWNVWNTVETDTFTLDKDTEVVFDFGGTGPAGYWGDIDNLKLFGTGGIAGGSSELDHDPTIAVEKVNGVDSDDFMRGTDVSSFLSILNSGAKFYDYEGNELDGQGFFDLLADAGFNYIRLRVWNDPYDAEGHGYGGGNCDVEAAKTMGLWATNAGMKVLIDFHYSDFWADPGKQKAPKAWAGYSADQKAEALDAFTYNSLKTLLEAGVNVGMVQVGNETTGSICGESNWANKAKLFSAGSAATRRISAEYEHPILVAIHFTNPERSGNYASQASNLNNYNVDYDVFASSWYPYWHGSTSNLTTVLKQVADNYGKQVVIAETSWAWTLDDGDGHDNTVRNGNNSSNNAYPFSVQGQADELVSATKALTAVGEAGVGVFYWENAWIPVQYAYDADGNLDNDILTSNKAKWEEFGSGWASSYAAEYDPNDAGVWYGGSACDNQAMFDFNGKALDSLWTWKYMMVGTEEAVEQEILSIEVPELDYEPGETLTLPNTIKVNYLVGGSANEPVAWDEADVAAVDMNTPGLYQIHGTVTTQLGDRNIVLKVRVTYPNLLLNFGFEDSDLSMYTFSGNYDWSTDTPHSGARCLHFYNSSARSLDFSQTVTLEPGEYVFSLYAQGDAKGGTEQYIYVTLGDETLTEDYALAGWSVWQHPELSFTVSETASVTVGAHIAYGAGGWGTFDDLYLGQAILDPLAALLAQIDALNPLDYTGASWAALMAAAAGAQEGTVDLETLQYALDNLELKSEAMALGSDISAAANGDRSYPDENGNQRKLYDIVANDYHYSMVRLRTWTGDENGSCGKNTIINYAKLCSDAGLRIMIDFHYADSWADPGKQPPPAAWNVTDDVSPEEADRVAQLLYDYTYDFISSMVAEGVYPEWVQVGNEINSGMVWPLGSTTYMDNFVKLLQAGTDAVRDASPTTKIVIHRSSGEETDNCIAFYQNLIDAGYTDFDVIGLSFYPSSTNATYLLSCLENTFNGLYENFCQDTHREIMITETGSVGGSNRNQSYNMIISEIRKLQAIPDGRGTGCMYWEIENAEYSGWGSNRRPTVVWKAFSPGADYINDKPVTGLALSATELSMQVNDAQSLSVTFTPSNPDMPEVTWESSNPEVASVNLAGLVLALSVGETDITVTSVHTADGTPVSATCHVTVTPEIPGLKNGGFELGDKYWVIDENIVGTAKISNSDNHLHGTYSLHYYASADGLDIGFTQAITGLEPGLYTLACRVMGESHEATGYIYADTAAKTHFQSENFQTTGWTSNESGWIYVTLADIVVGEDGELLVGAKVTASTTTAWGDFDDFTLVRQPEYYLVGDMNEWTPAEAFKLAAGDEDGKFILEDIELTAGTKVKVYDAVNDVWYPDGVGNDYEITEDGVYNVEFWPAGEMGEEYHGGFFKLTKVEVPEPTDITVYFVDEVGLEAVYFYSFLAETGASSGEWPGGLLEPIGQDRNNHNVYKIAIDASVHDSIIFSNGTDWQTTDLPFVEDAGENDSIVYFGNSNEADEQGHYKAWPAEDVEKIVSTTEPTCSAAGEIVFESFVTGAQRTEEIPQLDGAALAAAIEQAEGIDSEKYTEESVAAMLEALEAAKDAFENAHAQELVDEAAVALLAAIENLVEKAGFLFDDVQDPSKFYFEPVYWAFYHNPQITNGTTDTTFSPNKTCNRGAVVTFLWRAAGEPEPTITEHNFTDVKETAYYYKAMLWAVENGITAGTSETTFGPNKDCTRGQVVTFLWRYMGEPKATNREHSFTDVKESGYYYEAMLWAIEAGITNGTSDTTFSPNKTATRGQVVTFLFRAVNE